MSGRQQKVDTDSGDVYTGTSVLGTPDTSANWRIFKVDNTGSDADTLYPIDSSGFPSDKEVFKWSDRLLLNFASTKDVTVPTILSAARVDDTHIEVTLSELANQDSITKLLSTGGFTVEDLITPATLYVVASIAPGATNNKIILTVATIIGSVLTGVKVKYAAGVDGTVTDVA